MKRRKVLVGLAVVSATPIFASCAPEKQRSTETMYSVELWTDSNPEDFANSKAVRLAGASLEEHPEFKGLYELRHPLSARLPSGLNVEVTCERVATGHLNLGLTHDGAMESMGKYSGPFKVRVFPREHQPYILEVKLGSAATAGA